MVNFIWDKAILNMGGSGGGGASRNDSPHTLLGDYYRTTNLPKYIPVNQAKTLASIIRQQEQDGRTLGDIAAEVEDLRREGTISAKVYELLEKQLSE